jgi:hypothetical protein
LRMTKYKRKTKCVLTQPFVFLPLPSQVKSNTSLAARLLITWLSLVNVVSNNWVVISHHSVVFIFHPFFKIRQLLDHSFKNIYYFNFINLNLIGLTSVILSDKCYRQIQLGMTTNHFRNIAV